MKSKRYPSELKDEAVRQVHKRRNKVADVAERLGAFSHLNSATRVSAPICLPHLLVGTHRGHRGGLSLRTVLLARIMIPHVRHCEALGPMPHQSTVHDWCRARLRD